MTRTKWWWTSSCGLCMSGARETITACCGCQLSRAGPTVHTTHTNIHTLRTIRQSDDRFRFSNLILSPRIELVLVEDEREDTKDVTQKRI